MKIVETDNFNGDYPNEKVVASGIEKVDDAQVMCSALNEHYFAKYGKGYSRFHVVVSDTYILQPGFIP